MTLFYALFQINIKTEQINDQENVFCLRKNVLIQKALGIFFTPHTTIKQSGECVADCGVSNEVKRV